MTELELNFMKCVMAIATPLAKPLTYTQES